MRKSDPAYTKHPRRLQDVITAVQVLGNFQTATATTEKWQNRIGTPPVSATSWEKVFKDHPEFFRTYEHEEESGAQGIRITYSLVLRRSQQRTWLRTERRLATSQEITDFGSDLSKLTWPPVSVDQVTSLVDIAIKLHSAEWTHKEKSRWWLAIVTALAGFVGALLGALLKQ